MLTKLSLPFASIHAGALAIIAATLCPLTPALGQGSLNTWNGSSWDIYGNTPSGASFVKVSTGTFSATALRVDGSIASWGSDAQGLVSNAPSGTGFLDVASGDWQSLAVRSDGRLVSWGTDVNGTVLNTPSQSGFVRVSAGVENSMALRADGSIAVWGSDAVGQVSNAPTGQGFTQISAGKAFLLALHTDGSIQAWGSDSHGQVSSAPAGTGFVQVSAGRQHALALRADGSLHSWGDDAWSQVSGTPGGTGFTLIAAGSHKSVASRPDGLLTGWGLGFNGSSNDLPLGTGFIQLSTYSNAGIGIRAAVSGDSFCWGDGTGAACPCGFSGNPGSGCSWNGISAGSGKLTGYGTASLSSDTFGLYVSGLSPQLIGIIVRGSTTLGGGSGIQVSGGLLCVSGQTSRSQILSSGSWGNADFNHFNFQGFADSSNGLGTPTFYQHWSRQQPGTCPGSGVNFSNAWEVTWTL